MALTFTDVKRINIQKSGGIRFAIIDITFDASYATGGWAVAASDVKMTNIHGMLPMGPQVAAAGVTFGWDPVNSKLLAYKGAAGMLPEIAASDLSTRLARFFVVGS
jgi:hypothetical protein